MRRPFLTFCYLLLGLSLSGQSNNEVGIFIGASNYAGDLVASFTPHFNENGLGAGIFGRTSLSRQFNVRGNLRYGTLSGNDYNYEERMGRGFEFESHLAEVSAVAEWEPLGKKRFYADARGDIGMRFLVSPYVFTGLGMTFVKYEVDFSRYEGEALDEMIAKDESVGATNTTFALPVGLGVKFDMARHFTLGLEFTANYPFSDYIDGVSMSGNEEHADWYFFGGATIAYRFFN